MHSKAHVRLRAQARAETQLTAAHRARTGFTTTRPTGAGQLVVPSVISRTRGEAAARHLDTCN